MRGALNKSLHGRPITCEKVFTGLDILHTMPASGDDPAIVHEILLTISNPDDNMTVKCVVHYNNGVTYHVVPPRDSIPVRMTVEGDSSACTVANPHVAIGIIDPLSDGKLHVTGGYKT